MPPELLKAHRALDNAVMRLYGFGKFPASSGVLAKQAGRAASGIGSVKRHSLL
jgi:hypothetical protein